MRQTEIVEINLIEALGLLLILFAAIAIQIIFHDLPCPLCLLQRWGLLAVTFGFLLNLRFGIKSSHYAIVILATLFTAAVAIRQILLHIVPGTGSYGPAIFGYHMYTWVFIICAGLLIFTAVMLLFDKQFKVTRTKKHKTLSVLIHIVFFFAVVVATANSITTFLECGLRQCPDNPVTYEVMLQ